MKKLKSSKNLTKFYSQVVQSVVRSAIMDGEISPKRKSHKEMSDEINKYLRQLLKNKPKILFIIDHRSKLLKQARLFVAEKNYELSLVFYAIWIEHWVNHLIEVQVKRKRLSIDIVKDIIRETPFRAKITWLLYLFGIKKIHKRHQSLLEKVMSLRNSFIHYKWIGQDPDKDDPSKKALIRIISDLEKTIKYLNKYEATEIMYKTSRKLKKIINNK